MASIQEVVTTMRRSKTAIGFRNKKYHLLKSPDGFYSASIRKDDTGLISVQIMGNDIDAYQDRIHLFESKIHIGIMLIPIEGWEQY